MLKNGFNSVNLYEWFFISKFLKNNSYIRYWFVKSRKTLNILRNSKLCRTFCRPPLLLFIFLCLVKCKPRLNDTLAVTGKALVRLKHTLILQFVLNPRNITSK